MPVTSVYADPTHCPGCHAPLAGVPGSSQSCDACALPLTGRTAQQLFGTLREADRLVALLRSERVAAPGLAPTQPGAPAMPTIPARRGLGAPSVPKILLGLGALCLIVAAVTFLVVAWSWLGVGGRTAVLVLMTVLATGLGVWLWRRGLRLGAEALLTVGYGLLTLDVVGADDAGWLGELGTPGLTSVVGAALAVTGVALAAALRGRAAGEEPDATPVSAQLVAVVGLLLVPIGVVDAYDGASGSFALSSALLGGVSLALTRSRLGVLPVLALAPAALWWVPLVGVGLVDAIDRPTLRALFVEGRSWPLLAAAALMLVPSALAHRRPLVAAVPAGVAGAVLSATLAVPTYGNPADHLVLVASGLLVVWSLVALALPRSWAVAPALPGLGAGVVVLGATAALAGRVLEAQARPTPWAEAWTTTYPTTGGELSAWVAVPVAVSLVVAVAAAGRLRLVVAYAGPLASTVVVGIATSLVLAGAPVAGVLALLLVVAVGLLAWADQVRSFARGVPSGVALVLAAAAFTVSLVVASASVGLSAVALGVLTLSAAHQLLHAPARVGRVVAALALPAALGGLIVTLGDLAGLPEVWRAAPVLLALGALALLLPHWPLESSGAATAALAVLGSVTAAVDGSVALAAYLTLAGALVTLSALLHAERRALAWPGGLLLATATWVRLADLGVEAPEAYTLPTAVALVAVGLWRLHRSRDASTGSTLAPGLVLATVPSLLWVLVDDPFGVRALLLGLGCLVLVLVGTARRWNAPLLVGSLVGSAVVLRLLQPYAAELPPWMLIAAAGTTLLVVGVSWESRLRNLRETAGYLARLR